MAGAVVQYVVVRGDLLTHLGWPVGALIAQACHACTAVTHLFHDDEHMKVYLSDLDNMRKVVLQVNWFPSIVRWGALLKITSDDIVLMC